MSAAAALVVCAIAAKRFLFTPTPAERLIRSAAAQRWRPIAGRLTGFAHVPRATHANTGTDALKLHLAAISVLDDGHAEAHTGAVARLLDGEPAAAAAALGTLVTRSPQDASLWNDLAVARLEDAAAADDVRSIALSLVAADRALAIEPRHSEALFNRGLALEALGLRFAAADAWRRYLEVDPGSAWAAEAREHLAAANAPTHLDAWKQAEPELDAALDRNDTATVARLVAAFPLPARIAAESRHLPAWGDAVLKGDAAAAGKALNRARLIATALKKANGDALLDAAAAHVSEESARGFAAYGAGRAANLARHVAESLNPFAEAERDFAAAGNPMELNAAYFRANALVDLGRADEARAIAGRIEPRIDESWRSLRAHLLWLHLRLANDAGDFYGALVSTRAARSLFEALGETDYSCRLRATEASMLMRLGRDREAWQCHKAALTDAAASGRWNLVEVAIDAAARDQVDGPDAEIARSFYGIPAAAPAALPLTRFNSLLWRAFLDARIRGGTADVTAARAAASRIPDATQRENATDELRLMNGIALAKSDPAAAERELSAVIEFRTRTGNAAFLPAIHLQRARVRRALQRNGEAETDLRRAIELIESRQRRIPNDTLRDAFLGRSEDAFEELGDLLLARGDWMGAFRVSEQARARVLRDDAAREAEPLPANVVGAHYTSFASRTLMVVLEHGRMTHAVIDIPRTELRALRDRAAANPEDAAAMQRLYALLIAPLRDRISNDRLLVISPDDTTYGIPFAALRGADGRFLIQETAIAIAPSAAAMATALPPLQPARASIAIVADPAFSPALFPSLDRLPAARQDAYRLRRVFGHTTTLTEEGASVGAFAVAAQSCDVLHIAAHAFSSRRDATLSMIALAPANGDEGLLFLDRIASLPLRQHPLVVLAGCETGSLGGGRGSMRTLAHAFLATGSRAVLSTLWNVGDSATSEVTELFYRHLAAGETVADALRQAQLDTLSSHPPADWAGFQLMLGVEHRP